MIKAAYERLFVAFYGWSLKVDGKKQGYNVYYASIMLSLALFLNFASIAMIVDVLLPHSFLSSATKISRYWWVLIMITLTAGQYLYFSRGKRYQRLIVAYGHNEDRLVNAPHWKLLAYMVTSLALVIVLLVARLK